MKKTAISACAAFVLTACSLPSGDLDQKWVSAINEYRINPMYPPKEDYYIGNVYLHVYNAKCEEKNKYETAGCDFVSIKIGQLPAEEVYSLLKNNYGETWSFRAATDECKISLAPSTAGSKPDPSDTAKLEAPPSYIARPSRECFASDVIAKPAEHMNLRRVGFPDFFKSKSTGGSLAASLPMDSLPNFGIGVNNIESYSVSIPAAQYYAVNAIELIAYLKNNRNSIAINKVQKLKGLNSVYTSDAVSTLCEDCKANIVIPYEIYYSSIFDVEYTGSFNASVGFSRARNTDSSGNAYKTNLENGAIKIDDLLTSPTQGNFGVAAKITHASDNRIGLRRTYDVPLAVGYRGISLEVSQLDKWLGGDVTIKPGPYGVLNAPTVQTVKELPKWMGEPEPSSP
ncbi:hypothetical protein ACYZUD_11615 [Pseudomonas sp. XS1P51]